jgi:hypothetical protein
MLETVANSSSASRYLFGKARTWAPKVKKMLDMIPGGKLMPGLINTLKDFISLFEKMGVGTQKASAMIRRAAKNPMTTKEVQTLAKQVQTAVSKDGRLFRELGGASAKGVAGMKNYKMSGIPRLFGNKATRSLMRRTKFWAAFLDYLGVANFVGPDELINQMGEEQFNKSMNDYSQTNQAKQSWQDDFGNVQPEQSTPILFCFMKSCNTCGFFDLIAPEFILSCNHFCTSFGLPLPTCTSLPPPPLFIK